MNTVWYRNI